MKQKEKKHSISLEREGCKKRKKMERAVLVSSSLLWFAPVNEVLELILL